MITYTKKLVKSVDSIYCDMCGENCTKEQLGHEYGLLEAQWGYSSKQDGKTYDIHLCEKCFMNVITFIKKQRQCNLRPFNYPYEKDPLDGAY